MPVVRDTPPNFRYLGPLLWDATIGLPPWFSKLQKNKQDHLLHDGLDGRHTKFFQEAVRVFGNTELPGAHHDPAGWPRSTNTSLYNVFIAKYAPGEALDQR